MKKNIVSSNAFLILMLVSLCILLFSCTTHNTGGALSWPSLSSESKPWTYWWWPGSAVTKEDITANLEDFAAAGMGGVHIIPIYGVKGHEESFIPFLSEEWMSMLAHCTHEAARLGMGVDMTSGTGWPFGGPQLGADDAASSVRIEIEAVESDGRYVKNFEALLPQAVVAYPENGDALILTEMIDSVRKSLTLDSPKVPCELYFLYQEGTGQKVKRAAPGGTGDVLDYFDTRSLEHYLDRFDEAFETLGEKNVRAFYNDSFEVYKSNWTDNLLSEFQARRGYDLRNHLPALLNKSDSDENMRVAHDYNETVSELLLERFTKPWVNWCNAMGSMTRSQSHGSPGNLLDLYAAADIPETEAFGPSGFKIPGLRIDKNIPEHFGKPDYYVEKFASSAAHVAGKKLVSSESCTWLGEHFQVSLSQVKPEIDALFLAGINHVFFHGMAYSPKNAPWPGWLFYASTNFAQTGSFWRDLPEMNKYIARCQSFLQQGLPDNDILLYWPVHDVWMSESDEDMLHHFQVHNADEWLHGSAFHDVALSMKNSGYSFDYISDRQLGELTVQGSSLMSGETEYSTIVVPECSFMPPETLETLLECVREGASVIFMDGLPGDVPGWNDLDGNRAKLLAWKQLISTVASPDGTVRSDLLGTGRLLIGDEIGALLENTDCVQETFYGNGIGFIRRMNDDGHTYFIANNGSLPISDWITLGRSAESAIIYDAVSGKIGKASHRKVEKGLISIYLNLKPGESQIVRTFDTDIDTDQFWPEYEQNGQAVGIDSDWQVSFVEGTPELPDERTIGKLVSWTEFGGKKVTSFHGTARYSTNFNLNTSVADEWCLDLGKVCESAQVYVNGSYVGAVWSFPFEINIGEYLIDGENLLEIDVTNLAANRIRELDSRKVEWKIFHDINYVNIRYEPFDASVWELMDSGLLGPVRLVPLRERDFSD